MAPCLLPQLASFIHVNSDEFTASQEAKLWLKQRKVLVLYLKITASMPAYPVRGDFGLQVELTRTVSSTHRYQTKVSGYKLPTL